MAGWCNHLCSGKAINITYPGYLFVALCIQRAMLMRLTLNPWPARLSNIFPLYLINSMIFEKTLLNIKCVFWFSLQLLPETFLIFRIIQRDSIINVRRLLCKVPTIIVRF